MAYPNYTENVPLMSTNVWQSDPTFSYSLLSGVYKIAEKNLNQIFPNVKDLKSCKINEDDLLDFQYCGDGVEAEAFIEEFSGVFSYTVFWLLFGLVFSIVGIVWCLCNKCCCCCATGKENTIKDLVNTDPDFEIVGLNNNSDEPSKRKLYGRIIVGVLMALWIIGFSFSVFTAFASNESLRRSIFEFQDDVDKPLHDAELYLNTTKSQVHSVFVTSYGNLSDRIRESSLSYGRTNSQQPGLQNVQKLLEITDIFISHIATQERSPDENITLQLNGISHHLQSMKSSLKSEVVPLLHKIDDHIQIRVADMEEALRITGEQLQGNSQSLADALDEIPVADTRKDIQEADANVLEVVGSSIYGSFMAFNLVILAMLCGIIMGYVVTWIGKGSAKATGFIFYRFTITTMFAIGWIVTIAMLSGFTGAGYFSQIACETVRDLENNSSSNINEIELPMPSQPSLLNAFQNQNATGYEVPNYGHIVRFCKQGSSAYYAMKLEQVYDVESIFDISNNFGNQMVSREFMDNFFGKNVRSVYFLIEKELIALEKSEIRWSNITQSLNSSTLIDMSSLKKMYSEIQFQIRSVLEYIKALESGDILRSSIRQAGPIMDLVNDYENFVYDEFTNRVGQCEPLYVALNTTVHIFCYKVIAPVATYWFSLQLLLIMFFAVIITALVKERLFK